MSNLSSEKVDVTLTDCLCNPDTPDAVEVEAVLKTYLFSREALDRNRETIDGMLNALPAPFHEGDGDSWSFLNMCEDREGNQWADLHSTQEKLVALGIGVGRVHFPLPRSLWSALPGSVPYIGIRKTPQTS